MNGSRHTASASDMAQGDLRTAALHWLAVSDPAEKCAGVQALARAWRSGILPLDASAMLKSAQHVPGQPARPVLVPPRQVPRRAMNTLAGRAAMIHAMTHIEFNAINLALDALWRFPGMPDAYYADWLRVAEEEALHFHMLSGHLASLGHAYGDFPAHNGLWEWAEKTRDDVLARMALLPRTMEARGLDVTPALRARLVQAGDAAAGPILDIILRDEIGHVAIGNHWFAWLCAQRGLQVRQTYNRLLTDYRAPTLRAPFNLTARRAAGFGEEELESLARH